MEKQPIDRELAAVGELVRLVETLRGKNGCPWDRKQTPRTLSRYLLEEIYELMDAIESADPDDICEELGDVWFLILFITRIYQEAGHFDIGEVARRNAEKMIRRHPHVFGDGTARDADAVRARWHEIKKEEKKRAGSKSVLDGVPKQSPALMRAYRISERAARTGFDWQDVWGVLEKVDEELDELKVALKGSQRERASLEFGDVLFTLVNVARLARLHPESALADSTNKFEKRFRLMEEAIRRDGRDLESVPQSEKEVYWAEAKARLDL